MRYERPAIERRVDLTSPVIVGIARTSGFSPTWTHKDQGDGTEGPAR